MNPSRAIVSIMSLAVAAITPAIAGDIYSFVDSDGTVHFSNLPADSRYKRVVGLSSVETSKTVVPSQNFPVHAYSAFIKTAAEQNQLDEALLHAVIRTESGYNPNAVSPKGAVGLMQLMPGTAKRYGVVNPKDPAENIQAGARYLKDLLNKFGNDLGLALAAYNAGEMSVARYGNALPPYRETQAYVPQVLRLYQAYSGCMAIPCKASQ